MSKKYFLKRDLPDAKAIDIYCYNGSGRYLHMTNPNARSWPQELVEGNSEWWQEVVEPERIEVRIVPNENYAEGKWLGWYVLETSKAIPRHKLDAIKESIEKVLNPETDLQKEKDAIPLGELQPKEKDTLSRDWEINEMVFWSGEKSKDKLMISNWLIGHKRYEKWSIHSVRRLSDNTVWCVDGETLYGKIKMFQVSTSGELNVFFYIDGICRSIHDLQKLPSKPQPLFNWVVFTKEGFGFDTWAKKDWRGDLGSNWDESVKTFVTASEADEYILMNKPCLSLGDAANVLGVNLTCKIVADLRNLVKSKQ